MDIIELEVLNWGKYNPRKDVKHPSWFAMSNRVLENTDLFDFTADEFKAFVYILCQASQQGSSTIQLKPAHAHRVCGIVEGVLLNAIEKLISAQICERTSRPRNAHVTQPVRPREPTDKQTDIHNILENNENQKEVFEGLKTKETETLLTTCSQEVQRSWLALYQDVGWIKEELMKMDIWLKSNPGKRKAPWPKFISGWLQRAWQNQKIPAVQKRKIKTVDL